MNATTTTNPAVSYRAEGYAAKYFAKQPKQRDFVMLPPRGLDHITFNTPDDGVLAGYVSVIRQHLGNGQKFAWVELDKELAGQFRGVPLADILTCDDAGSLRRNMPNQQARRLCLSDYSEKLKSEPLSVASTDTGQPVTP
ncbi:hypothetical protein HBH1_04378 [Herbaspirillum sp. BH-1]|uniref:Uncharacterized protein n=1 Tax=Herbaspirillum frisingense TaxID=92645 RepID=A0ABU1PDI4_9BURK|nr:MULTISPECIES: hypothetical protein [Herbaspirillum]MDR6583423.1 hypothetical protein [Herbaspirillum frisingense]PLY57286.1 hypothetical protein HBH1_04378 [Herbaspirillum sp. BH-1]